MLKIILVALFVYAIIVVILVFKQRDLLYKPSSECPQPAQYGLHNMQVITLNTADQLTLQAWYQAAPANKATIIFFHGNNGHLGERVHRIKALLDAGYGVLLTSYRGFSGNPGLPSEQGLYQDARAAIQYLVNHKVATHCIVLYGESLGSGVAVQMAMEHPLAGLMLLSPYTSMVDVAHHHYPWAPVTLILRDRFDSLSKITQIKAPIYIAHGRADTVIPSRLGQQLFSAANSPKQFKLFEGVHHTDFPETLNNEILSFLANLAITNCTPQKTLTQPSTDSTSALNLSTTQHETHITAN